MGLLIIILELLRSCPGIFRTFEGKLLVVFYCSGYKFIVTQHICIGLNILQPLRHTKDEPWLCDVGSGVVLWGVFTFSTICWKKNAFFSSFFNVIRGERFWFLFQYQQAKNYARVPKIDPNIYTFSIVDIRDLTIFVFKNVIF